MKVCRVTETLHLLSVISRELSSCFHALKCRYVHFLVSVLPPVISHQVFFVCLFLFSVSLLLFYILLFPHFTLAFFLPLVFLPVPFWNVSLLLPTRRAGPNRSGCQTGFWISLRMESLQHLWAICSSIWTPLMVVFFFFKSKQNFPRHNFVRCLSSCHGAPPRRVWLWLLYILQPDSCSQHWSHPWAFFSPDCTDVARSASLCGTSQGCSRWLLTILVVLHWTC